MRLCLFCLAETAVNIERAFCCIAPHGGVANSSHGEMLKMTKGFAAIKCEKIQKEN